MYWRIEGEGLRAMPNSNAQNGLFVLTNDKINNKNKIRKTSKLRNFKIKWANQWMGENECWSGQPHKILPAQNGSCQGQTGKNTQFHQELWRNLVIVLKISAYMLCSVAPKEFFGALTTAPKCQCNGSAETSSATDGFFPVGCQG